MPKIDLNITEIPTGLQTRVKVNKVEYSKAFSWSRYKSRESALSAARRFRNKIYKEHGLSKPKPTPSGYRRAHNNFKYIDNATTGIIGVNRSCTIDTRRPNYGERIVYTAFWYDRWYDGTPEAPKPRSKVFHCGYAGEVTPAMELAALSAARDFRAAYERALDSNRRFVISPRWKLWREEYGPGLEWPSRARI